MWNIFYSIVTKLLPPDATDERVQRAWRNAIGWTLMSLVVFAAFMLFAMTSGIPWFGNQLVWADDVPAKVGPAVQENRAQIVELSKKVESVERTLNAQTESLNSFLAQSKAAEIRAQKLKRCNATTSLERDGYNREIDRLQGEYWRLKGERYDAPACAEL